MTGGSSEAGRPAAQNENSLEMRYPTHQVVAVLDTAQQLDDALEALTSGGFLESEIGVGSGTEMADRLGATTGRSGFAAQAIRFAEALGMSNEEVEAKARYERAMRDGHYVIAIVAPTPERKERAAAILAEQRARDVGYFGRFTIERLNPPGPPSPPPATRDNSPL